mgnify:FL=1
MLFDERDLPIDANGMWLITTDIYTEKDGQTFSGVTSHVAWGDRVFAARIAAEVLEKEMFYTLRKSRAKGGKIMSASWRFSGFLPGEQAREMQIQRGDNHFTIRDGKVQ